MALTLALVFLLIILTAAIVAVCVVMMKTRNTLNLQIGEITSKVNTHLEQMVRVTQSTGEGSAKLMSEVYTRLGALEESTKRIFEVGKDIGKLQDVLKAPKSRGGFGELMLEDVLRQMIPHDHFDLQHQFKSGARVDAAIFVGEYLVSVDAKFPLENFERMLATEGDHKIRFRREFIKDVKKHVTSISDKYILPDEGTFDFALMYVPSENIYYELLSGSKEASDLSLSQHSLERHVIPVSPNTFYAYLQVILMGLRGLRVDEAAREIAESLLTLRNDFQRITDDYSTLGTHLTHAKGSYERVLRGIDQFQGKLSSVDQSKSLSEPKKSSVEASQK